METIDAKFGVLTGNEAVEGLETVRACIRVEDRGSVDVVPADHEVESRNGDGTDHIAVDQLERAVADSKVQVGRVNERGSDQKKNTIASTASDIDAGDDGGVGIETLDTQKTTVDIKGDTIEQDTTERGVGDGLGSTLKTDSSTVAEGEVGLEVVELGAGGLSVVGKRQGGRGEGQVKSTCSLTSTDERELCSGVGVGRVDGGYLSAFEEDGEGVGSADDGERETKGKTNDSGKSAREGSGVVCSLGSVDQSEGANADALDGVDGLRSLERYSELEGGDTGAEPSNVLTIGLTNRDAASLGGESVTVDVGGEELSEQVEFSGIVVVRNESAIEGDDVACRGDVEVIGASRAEEHALVVEGEVKGAELNTERRGVDERGSNGECNTTVGVIAGKLEVQDLDILKVVETLDDDVLVEDEILVSWQEGEGLDMDIGAVELPCELRLRDEEFGKLAETCDILDLKVGGLLEAGVARQRRVSTRLSERQGWMERWEQLTCLMRP